MLHIFRVLPRHLISTRHLVAGSGVHGNLWPGFWLLSFDHLITSRVFVVNKSSGHPILVLSSSSSKSHFWDRALPSARWRQQCQ